MVILPSAVCRMALVIKLLKTCSIRSGSILTFGRFSGKLVFILVPFPGLSERTGQLYDFVCYLPGWPLMKFDNMIIRHIEILANIPIEVNGHSGSTRRINYAEPPFLSFFFPFHT